MVNAVLFVQVRFFDLISLEQLHHPAWVEIDAEGDATSVLAKMFDGKSQPSRTGWAEHQPIGTFGEIFIGQRVAEDFVIDAMVFDHHTALGDPRRAARFENEYRSPLVAFGNPSTNRPASQPLVFEVWKLL